MDANWEAVRTIERYQYETLNDLKAHMLYMKHKGYTVWEFSKTDLWAEYDMNELCNGTTRVESIEDIEFI